MGIAGERIVHSDGSSSSTWSNTRSMDNTIYRTLSRQTFLKTLEIPEVVKNEFDLFLQYGEDKTGGAENVDFDVFDEYLGSIGVTNEWNY